jgi:membrane associated rhomboid family serine protease
LIKEASVIPIGDDNRTRRRTPVVTYAIIAVCVLVFLLELMQGDAFIEQWAFVPRRLETDPFLAIVTIFTSMFMHAGWLHLGGNMLYLWIFGDNVEDRLGHGLFLVFYIVCGIAATMAQYVFSMGSTIPNLGASGAIAGVLGAYIVMFPGRRVQMLVGRSVVAMSALAAIGIWIVLQIFAGIGQIATSAQSDGGGVAYMAHIGGFVAGLALGYILGAARPQLPGPS